MTSGLPLCHSVHALLHPARPGCKPTLGLWLRVTWENSMPCALPYHAPSCSANGTVMFCLTWLAPAPPPSLQQSQVRREPFLERPPSPRAAEASGALSSNQHRAGQTFAGKAPEPTEPLPCWAHTAWPRGSPALGAAGDFQSSLSGRCRNGWGHLRDGSRGFTAGQA